MDPKTEYIQLFKIYQPKPVNRQVTKVAELREGGRWNKDKLNATLKPEDADLISKIPLSWNRRRDKQIWHFTKDGNYTVKSGYKVARAICRKLEEKGKTWGECSEEKPEQDFSKGMWTIKAQPKVVRNQAIFDKRVAKPEILLKKARAQNDEFWEAEKKNVAPLELGRGTRQETRGQGSRKWERPRDGWIKINIDGAVDKNKGNGGVGVIARNSQGKMIWAASCMMPDSTNPQLVEAAAWRFAVGAASRMQEPKVIFEGDCKMIVDILNKKGVSDMNMEVYISDILYSIGSFENHLFMYTPRTCNGLAHVVARQALHTSMQHWWFNPFPYLGEIDIQD